METEDGEQPIGLIVGLGAFLTMLLLVIVVSILWWVFTGNLPTFGILG